MKQIVIYGSYGYTGELIAELAMESGKPVLLSGRDEEKLRNQSEKLGLPYLKASLDSESEMDNLLRDAALVIHCAGPFVHTWSEMVKACLRNGSHYLDITGEIPVFESLKRMDDSFKKAGIMVMPGTGFDVVPTDCMASYLHHLMPDATQLELAFMGLGGGVSRGTAKTMLENLGSGGAIRKDGVLTKVPAAYKSKEIHFIKKESLAVSIPWGDLSTAFTTTGIENITVYMAVPRKMIRLMTFSNTIRPILNMGFVKAFFRRKIDQRPAGPNPDQRKKGISMIWGRVENESGESREAVIQTAEGYRLTAEMSWKIACKVFDGNFEAGYWTPSGQYGPGLIFEHPDTVWLLDGRRET